MAGRRASPHADRAIDGDTIRVQLDGARYTVRLTSVDTPETRHPTRGVEPDGPEAAAYTTARLTGATVRLDRDPAGDDIDADGRLLRYVVPRHGDPRVPVLPTTRMFTAGSPGAPGAPRAMEPLT